MIVIFLFLLLHLVPHQSAARPSSSVPSIWEKNNLKFEGIENNLKFEIRTPHIAVFIHAALGEFKKKRGKVGYWGYGKDILLEIISVIESSGLLADNLTRGVYITALGSTADIASTREAIYRSPLRNEKIHFLVTGPNLELQEFPALHALQYYASLPQTHPDSKLLYLHTKGVRQNGLMMPNASIANDSAVLEGGPHDWRRYMLYFLVEHYAKLCFRAMDERGFLTCGALKQQEIYAGNFWWTRASYMRDKKPPVASMEWTGAGRKRFAAEEYILKGWFGLFGLFDC